MTEIKQVPKLINDSLYRLINKSVDFTLLRIEKRVEVIQNRFFTYLVNASGIIGASKTPSLAGGNIPFPKWDLKFNKDYLRTKRKGYENRFFINSGELKETLRGLSSNKIFGKPTIVFFQPGQTSNRIFTSKNKGGFNVKSNKDFKAIQQIGTISIDFFPKLQTSFKSQYGPQFFKQFFNQRQSAPTGHKPVFVGMKLDNAFTKRPFIGQYMQWWVKVKAKQSVLKGIA